MEFKDILSNLMKERGISMSQLAKDTGIAKSSVHGFINGAEPPLNKVKTLAEYFKVSMDYMSTGEIYVGDPLEQLLKVEIHKACYEITVKKIVNKNGKD